MLTRLMTIPLCDLNAQFRPLKADVMRAIEDVLDSMHLFLGPNIAAFESEFAAYCGTQFCVTVANGTDALHLALRAANIGPGDEVITVAHTFFATAEAIHLVGARPVFVDIDPETYTLDPSQIESRLTPRTRAILPVHLYGQIADMDPIMDLAARHGLVVIEDAAQAHGADYRGRRAGSIGHLGCFSFYFSKNLGAYGEAGAVTTSDPELAQRLRLYRDHGSEVRYHHQVFGHNARMDEIQAAVLRVKLPHLDAAFDIATGIHFPVPIHLQPAARPLGYQPGDLPHTERAASEVLSIPMYPELTDEQLQRVAEAVGPAARLEPAGQKPQVSGRW
jgi:dTDP-4-amino-4,6-dideoxygalactose transaminase